MARILIIGGVAGGATAATRLRRLDEHAEIIVFERGPYVSFANCGLPYYLGGIIKNRESLLLGSPEAFDENRNIEVRVMTEVTAIDPADKTVTVHELETGLTKKESYDKLIMAPGAAPIRPDIPGIDLEGVYTLRNVPDTDLVKLHLDERAPKEAVVVGGGFIGLEMAENLSHMGLKVVLLEKMDQVMTALDYEMAALVEDHLKNKGLDLRLGQGLASIEQVDGRLKATTDLGLEIMCDMIMLAMGVRPESKLARDAGLAVDDKGYILVDDALRTSDPDIFAVGDAIVVRDFITGVRRPVPLAGPANRQARIAADNAMGRLSLYRGTLGTSAVKVFDMTAAAAGASEKQLEDSGLDYLISFIHAESHVTYYPGADPISIKVIFAPGSGKILGAQVFGGQGTDKRIDVLATAIRAGMTVFDLEELELAYAPPYGAAKDPVNLAGYVAVNTLKGDVENAYHHDWEGYDPARDVIVDVRTRPELRLHGRINGSINVQMNELRSWMQDLDRSKRYLFYCAAGQRAYYAYRMMVQKGFNAVNLNGGFATYNPVSGRFGPGVEDYK